MGDITAHFSKHEFQCPCCGKYDMVKSFIERLELLHDKLNAKSIIVSSGYRCPQHSVDVGGYRTDAHTRGFAADICAYRQDGTLYPAATVAYAAEKVGFGGIGIINDNYVHVDSRDQLVYDNNHWWADERTGKNYTTFAGICNETFVPRGTKTVKIVVNGKTVFETSKSVTINMQEV